MNDGIIITLIICGFILIIVIVTSLRICFENLEKYKLIKKDLKGKVIIEKYNLELLKRYHLKLIKLIINKFL